MVENQGIFMPQILREINFEESGSAKFAILAHLEALNFYFYEFFCHSDFT